MSLSIQGGEDESEPGDTGKSILRMMYLSTEQSKLGSVSKKYCLHTLRLVEFKGGRK